MRKPFERRHSAPIGDLVQRRSLLDGAEVDAARGGGGGEEGDGRRVAFELGDRLERVLAPTLADERGYEEARTQRKAGDDVADQIIGELGEREDRISLSGDLGDQSARAPYMPKK